MFCLRLIWTAYGLSSVKRSDSSPPPGIALIALTCVSLSAVYTLTPPPSYHFFFCCVSLFILSVFIASLSIVCVCLWGFSSVYLFPLHWTASILVFVYRLPVKSTFISCLLTGEQGPACCFPLETSVLQSPNPACIKMSWRNTLNPYFFLS